jgi:hypothetical protein
MGVLRGTGDIGSILLDQSLLMSPPNARTAPDKTAIEHQIAATDKQIDHPVSELSGSTEDEIRIVEGTVK